MRFNTNSIGARERIADNVDGLDAAVKSLERGCNVLGSLHLERNYFELERASVQFDTAPA